MVIIKEVEPGSPAAQAGILPGDNLISINGNPIRDVLDYRFYLAERSVTLLLEREGRELSVGLRKGEYSDIGLGFETALMDKKHSCANKCIFCFIDQLPRGMRGSLYFKDDDSRLSFLHGNYITLTNLLEEDVERIIRMRISPLRVSLHTTNPELRVRMMKNRRAGEVLGYLRRIADAGIDIDAQIVLCRGVNDGAELESTLRDLVSYRPALKSVAIVPAGLTGHRSGLYTLEPFTPAECAAIIAQVDGHAAECAARFGSRLFFCADEFYIKAALPVPPAEYYEDFAQLENGVGMAAMMGEEFERELESIPLPERSSRRVSVATGEAASPLITMMAERLCVSVPGLEVMVHPIKNNFFGGHITVSGLLTGRDIADQLAGADLGDELLIPAAALKREEDIFLDDMTLTELKGRLGLPVRGLPNDGGVLLRALAGTY